MFFGKLAENQIDDLFNLVEEVSDLEKIAESPNDTFLRHSNCVLNKKLTWFQCMCIEHTLITGGSIVSLDTGLGKTCTSIGLINNTIKEDDEDGIAVFYAIPSSLEQVERDLKEGSYLPVTTITGEASSIQKLGRMRNGILLCSYEATYSPDFANYIFDLRDKIKVQIMDEAHLLTNDSILNSNLTALMSMPSKRMVLTATPITNKPTQIITLLNMLDSIMIEEGDNLLKPYEIRDQETFELIDYKPLNDLSAEFYPRYVSWTREELGLIGKYYVRPILVPPTEEQMQATLKDIPTILKGNRDSLQVKTFVALVKDLTNSGKIGLCYSRYRENSEMLKEELSKAGIRVAVLNGEDESRKNRSTIIDSFNLKDYDIVITSLTMSLNLDCDYCIFWDNTSLVKQMIGRCLRGFNPKDLWIYFILTDMSVELFQFYDNVYKKTKWSSESLGKDNKVIEKIEELIRDNVEMYKEYKMCV